MAKQSGRETIHTGTETRYGRRDQAGEFKESDNVGRCLAKDVKKPAQTNVKAGQGDRGDRKKK
jgi:hypothetical protein